MKSKFELFSWARSHKAVAPICNINNLFGLETASERTMQWWFKKFCKGDKSLEDEDHSGWPLKIDNDHLRTDINADLLQLHKLSKNLASTILWSFGIWSKLERYKSSVSECLMSWQQIKKIVILKCRLLLFYATAMNHFLIRLWCMMKKWILYDSQQ